MKLTFQLLALIFYSIENFNGCLGDPKPEEKIEEVVNEFIGCMFSPLNTEKDLDKKINYDLQNNNGKLDEEIELLYNHFYCRIVVEIYNGQNGCNVKAVPYAQSIKYDENAIKRLNKLSDQIVDKITEIFKKAKKIEVIEVKSCVIGTDKIDFSSTSTIMSYAAFLEKLNQPKSDKLLADYLEKMNFYQREYLFRNVMVPNLFKNEIGDNIVGKDLNDKVVKIPRVPKRPQPIPVLKGDSTVEISRHHVVPLDTLRNFFWEYFEASHTKNSVVYTIVENRLDIFFRKLIIADYNLQVKVIEGIHQSHKVAAKDVIQNKDRMEGLVRQEAIWTLGGNSFEGPSPKLRGVFDADDNFEYESRKIIGDDRYNALKHVYNDFEEFIFNSKNKRYEFPEYKWKDGTRSLMLYIVSTSFFKMVPMDEDQWEKRKPIAREVMRYISKRTFDIKLEELRNTKNDRNNDFFKVQLDTESYAIKTDKLSNCYSLKTKKLREAWEYFEVLSEEYGNQKELNQFNTAFKNTCESLLDDNTYKNNLHEYTDSRKTYEKLLLVFTKDLKKCFNYKENNEPAEESKECKELRKFFVDKLFYYNSDKLQCTVDKEKKTELKITIRKIWDWIDSIDWIDTQDNENKSNEASEEPPTKRSKENRATAKRKRSVMVEEKKSQD